MAEGTIKTLTDRGFGFIKAGGDKDLFFHSSSVVNSSITPGNAQMAEGGIKKLTDKGFGFINTGGAKDLFFHSSSVQGVSFEDLHEGQKVSYTEGQGPKGPRAEHVKPV